MNTVLLTAGVVALLAAVIGGGLKAFNIEMPVLTSARVRVAVGTLGIAFLIAAFLLREDSAGKDPAVAQYQRQVAAACNAVRQLKARAPAEIGIDMGALASSSGAGPPNLSPGQVFTVDRETLLTGERSKQVAIRRRFELLLAKREPGSLRDEADALRTAVSSYVRDESSFRQELKDTLPERPHLEDLQAAYAAHEPQADEHLAQLEDAMNELGDRDCSLTTNA